MLAGLLGSSHCLGMCGGIVGALSLSFDRRPDQQPVFGYQLAYNLGRIVGYVLVGLFAGTLGTGLARLGVSPTAGQLVATAFMIALGLYLADWWRGLMFFERAGYRIWRYIQPLGRRLLPIRHPGQAFCLGMLWGWLPCGLVYAMVAWSLSTASITDGALIMLGFGLGTLPALLVAGRVFSRIVSWGRSPLARGLAGTSVILFGLYGAYNSLVGHSHHHHTMSDINSGNLFVDNPQAGNFIQSGVVDNFNFAATDFQDTAILEPGQGATHGFHCESQITADFLS